MPIPSEGAETLAVAPRLLAGAVMALSGVAVLPLALHVLRRHAPPPDPEPEARGAPWGPSDLIQVAAVVVVAHLLLWFALPRDGAPSLFLGFLAAAGSLAAGAAFAAHRARRAGVAPAAAFALELRGLARAAGGGLLGYLLFVPALLGIALGWTALLESAGVEDLMQPVVRTMRDLPAGDRPWALLFGVAIGPFFEELFFRGFVQRTLARHLAGGAAVGITSACFALLHGPAAFLPVFALALILGGIAHTTRRVLAAWVVHAVFNAQTFVFLWLLPEVGRALEGGSTGFSAG